MKLSSLIIMNQIKNLVKTMTMLLQINNSVILIHVKIHKKVIKIQKKAQIMRTSIKMLIKKKINLIILNNK